MRVEVVYLPQDLKPEHLRDRSVVVLDVLRATTSMIAALNACAREIRIFDSLTAARASACLSRASSTGGAADQNLLCGEQRCRKPDDFDLGNSPGDFTRDKISGRTLFMSTTNGTRAVVAARAAPVVLIGALVNARAVARVLKKLGRDVTLLCAGTDGQYSEEDAFGTGAIIAHIDGHPIGEPAVKCLELFSTHKLPPATIFRNTKGGQNIISAGLEPDIDFAAQESVFDVVGEVRKTDDNQIAVFRHEEAV